MRNSGVTPELKQLYKQARAILAQSHQSDTVRRFFELAAPLFAEELTMDDIAAKCRRRNNGQDQG